jgi:glucosamine-6-phosphate deaminase
MMEMCIATDRIAMSRAAAAHAAASIRAAIEANGIARIVAATGASQLDFLAALVAEPGIDWSRVEMFHLDEYVGLPASHPASFRRYLREHLVTPAGLGTAHFLDVDEHPEAAAAAVGRELAERPVDVAFVGIGENGHLAFNDPPADFETAQAYLLVTLDEACRAQQVGEGWFASMADVPRTAVSMSVRQILEAREIVAVVPDARKAEAVRASLDGEIRPSVPASALRRHPHVTLYLDRPAASKLDDALVDRAGSRVRYI